jgi:hypothetical protein
MFATCRKRQLCVLALSSRQNLSLSPYSAPSGVEGDKRTSRQWISQHMSATLLTGRFCKM